MCEVGNVNPMDCTDIVIGAAVGELSRVGDYYTSDRSTPRHDEFYGGSQSLTAAIASQVNGTTTVIFRRPIDGLYRPSFYYYFYWPTSTKPQAL